VQGWRAWTTRAQSAGLLQVRISVAPSAWQTQFVQVSHCDCWQFTESPVQAQSHILVKGLQLP